MYKIRKEHGIIHVGIEVTVTKGMLWWKRMETEWRTIGERGGPAGAGNPPIIFKSLKAAQKFIEEERSGPKFYTVE